VHYYRKHLPWHTIRAHNQGGESWMLLEKCAFVAADGVQCNQAARIGARYCIIHDRKNPTGRAKLSPSDAANLAGSGTRIAVAVWELVRDDLISETKGRRLLRQFWNEVGYGVSPRAITRLRRPAPAQAGSGDTPRTGGKARVVKPVAAEKKSKPASKPKAKAKAKPKKKLAKKKAIPKQK
jgi:hypothetical protein